MEKHINQLKHNEVFHEAVCTNHPDDFFDWKTTILFYVAIHCLKALADRKGIDIGNTHHEIERNIHPERNHVAMRIKATAFYEYKRLFDYSRTSRYEGIISVATYNAIRKADYLQSMEHLRKFKLYIQGQGVPV